MKKLLKRMNRGIALGIVLVIGVVIYVIAGNMHFKKEKGTIKEAVNDYISGFHENLRDTPDKLDEYIGKKWTSEELTSDGWFIDSILLKEYVAECNKHYTKGVTLTCEDSRINKLSIKKYGDNGAYVTLEANMKYKIEKEDEESKVLDGDFNFVTPFGEVYVYNEYIDEQDKSDGESYKGIQANVNYEGSVYLLKEDGEWKVSQACECAYVERMSLLKGDEE